MMITGMVLVSGLTDIILSCYPDEYTFVGGPAGFLHFMPLTTNNDVPQQDLVVQTRPQVDIQFGNYIHTTEARPIALQLSTMYSETG
jgi:hypothetical protein